MVCQRMHLAYVISAIADGNGKSERRKRATQKEWKKKARVYIKMPWQMEILRMAAGTDQVK